MEEKLYQPAEGDRYATRYGYSNLSSKEVEAEPAYGDYAAEEGEYPIGDGQDIDQSVLPAEYYTEDEYANNRHTRGYLPTTRTAKGMGAAASKYASGHGVRGTAPSQTRSPTYNEVGDFRRTGVRENYNYMKNDPNAYYQHAPDYSVSKVRRESLFRNLTDKDYRNKVQKIMREERLNQDRYSAAANYYGHEVDEPLTHDDLLQNFKKNYKMDARKPPPSVSKAVGPIAQMKMSTKKPLSPRSDTVALRENYDEAYKRFYAGQAEKSAGVSGTKDTRSEPVQPDYSKFMKTPKRRLFKEFSPRRQLTANDYAHEMLRNSHQKSNDLELKYKNDAYGKLTQEDTDAGLQERQASYTIHENENQQSSVTSLSHLKSSDEKVSPPRKNVSKIRASVRSNRSKKSSNTGRSKKYDDLVKLQKSKCTIMSVIYDGIQKCEQAKYEVLPQMKSYKGENYLPSASKQSQTIQNDRSQEGSTITMDIMSSEIISNMFKEFRDYHLQNISQEVKRIQYLDVLPQKLSNLQGPQ